MVGCDRQTGRIQWTLDAGNNDDGHMSSVAVGHDDHILVVTNEPEAHGLSGGSHLLSVSTSGEIEWTTEVDAVSRGLALQEELVVVATRDGPVGGFNPDTGGRQWSTDLDGTVGSQSMPVWFDDQLWIPREDGLVDGLDPANGAPQTQFGELIELDDDSLSNVTPAVAVDDERLLIGSNDGSVAAYGPNLNQQWEYDGGTQIAAIDTIDHRIAVLDQRGQYTELDAETGEAERSFLLVDRQRKDWCGFDSSSERFRGLAAMSRQSIVVTGRMFGTQFFRLPRRE
jgi:outer membrane protein assembly factor BamB